MLQLNKQQQQQQLNMELTLAQIALMTLFAGFVSCTANAATNTQTAGGTTASNTEVAGDGMMAGIWKSMEAHPYIYGGVGVVVLLLIASGVYVAMSKPKESDL